MSAAAVAAPPSPLPLVLVLVRFPFHCNWSMAILGWQHQVLVNTEIS
jgi:hypothetical protein